MEAQQLIRPYKQAAPYAGPGQGKRARHPHTGRQPLARRGLTLGLLAQMPPEDIVEVLEAVGLLPARRACAAPVVALHRALSAPLGPRPAPYPLAAWLRHVPGKGKGPRVLHHRMLALELCLGLSAAGWLEGIPHLVRGMAGQEI